MIEFTQYVMPYGRTRPVHVPRPAHVEGMAAILAHDGYVFEIELLTTGHVSMTVEKRGEDDFPIAHEICPNGPEVGETVDRLITNAYERVTSKKG